MKKKIMSCYCFQTRKKNIYFNNKIYGHVVFKKISYPIKVAGSAKK